VSNENDYGMVERPYDVIEVIFLGLMVIEDIILIIVAFKS
jgi:hypothetical protein